MSRPDPRAAPPPTLEDFPLRSYDKLRYGDTDRQGHVNNAVFATLLETGRVEMFFAGDSALADPGCSFVIAHLSLDYLAELRWPGRVDIGTRVLSVGRSSLRVEQALFQGALLAALAQTVIVQVSEQTRKGHPFSSAQIERLQPYLGGRYGSG
jgi:acyl-CoA thioester hydrolase